MNLQKMKEIRRKAEYESLSLEKYKMLLEEDRQYQERMINVKNEAYLRKLKDII